MTGVSEEIIQPSVTPTEASDPAAILRGVRKTFAANGHRHEALRGIDLAIRRGEIHGLLGSSGAGKTTLLRCLLRLETPDSGEILIDGQDWTKLRQSELRLQRHRVGVVFQNLHLVTSRTVAANVALPLEIAGVPREQRRQRVDELLDWFGVRDKAEEYPARLSGGQRQRVALARALITHPSLLLADEPTSALDVHTKLSVLNTLKRVRDEFNVTVMVITHDLSAAEILCDSISLLEAGRITDSGPAVLLLDKARNRIAPTPSEETWK